MYTYEYGLRKDAVLIITKARRHSLVDPVYQPWNPPGRRRGRVFRPWLLLELGNGLLLVIEGQDKVYVQLWLFED